MQWTLLELPKESGFLLSIGGELLQGPPCSCYLCGAIGELVLCVGEHARCANQEDLLRTTKRRDKQHRPSISQFTEIASAVPAAGFHASFPS